jgi:SAM-dependent methyltransferase
MTERTGFSYQGQELDIFAEAVHWKAYWASRIRRWVRGDVLEVGAGLGANTSLLQNSDIRSWRCIEPDPELANKLAGAVAHLPVCSVSTGTIASVAESRFDLILYIDVLEHIERDRDELAAAAKMLRDGGHVIVLSPAHQLLFSEFDASIGHYRRYNRTSLLACSPPDCRLEAMFYLDCVGMFASLANRILLRQSNPTATQIGLWDNYMVPVSRVVDPVFGYSVGKTICGVWERNGEMGGHRHKHD